MHGEHGLSERQACAALGLSRTVYRYEPKPRDDSPIIEALLGLADRYPRYGFGKLFAVLRRHGFRWNHKRVYRVYCLLKMNLRRKGKKRLPSRNPQPLAVPPCANVCWSIDFMHDALVLISTLMEPPIGTLIEPAKVRDFRSDDLVWLRVYESPLQGERSLRGVL